MEKGHHIVHHVVDTGEPLGIFEESILYPNVLCQEYLPHTKLMFNGMLKCEQHSAIPSHRHGST